MLRILRNQNGQAVAFVAVAIAALLAFAGLVVNYGTLTINKTQLQTAADAAALAGAQDLVPGPNYNQTNAQNTAKAYAKLSPGQATDTVDTPKVTRLSSTVSTIAVTTRRSVSTLWGSYNLQATATAQTAAAGAIPPGSPPFAIKAPKNINWRGGANNDLYSQSYYMKINPKGENDFTYVNTVFKNPTSWEEYYNLLSDGYEKTVTTDTALYWVAQASGGEKSVQSFAKRLTEGNSDITKAQFGDPRLMMIPLLETLPTSATNGPDWSYSTKGLKIVGFVGFWFDSVYYGPLKNGRYPDFYVTGRFIKIGLPPGSSTVTGGQYFGSYQIQLIK